MTGGGLPDAPDHAFRTHFRGDLPSGSLRPHTGIIYTPPSYSDHIGVTLFLDHSLMRELQVSLSLSLSLGLMVYFSL